MNYDILKLNDADLQKLQYIDSQIEEIKKAIEKVKDNDLVVDILRGSLKHLKQVRSDIFSHYLKDSFKIIRESISEVEIWSSQESNTIALKNIYDQLNHIEKVNELIKD
jgi:hypothetical protein